MTKPCKGDIAPPPNASIPHVPLVDLDAVSATQGAELVLEAHLVVVLLLILDVATEGVEARLPDGEDAVAALPGEVAIGVAPGLDPLRGVFLDLLDDLGDRDGAREGEEDVHVVIGAAELMGGAAEAAARAYEVALELLLDLGADEAMAALGAEGEVEQDVGQGLCYRTLSLPGMTPLQGLGVGRTP